MADSRVEEEVVMKLIVKAVKVKSNKSKSNKQKKIAIVAGM